MYCRFCGKQIPDDATFCSYCGKKLAYDPDAKAEVKEEKVVDEAYNAFKKDYTKGFLPGLIWFGALSVIASFFLIIGFIIVALTYIRNGGSFIFYTIFEFIALMQFLSQESYYIVVPIMYTIGYLVSSIVAMIVGKKIAYGKNGEFKPARNIRKLSAKELILVILVAFGLWGIGVIIGNIPGFFSEGGSSEIELIFGKYTIIYLLQAIICAPIFEEFFFRKLMIDRASGRGEGLAILASATMFGLMHGNLGQFFLAFLIGLLFGVVYSKTRNIKYTMGLHCMINTIASLPEIFALFNINIALGWYIAVATLMVVGIIIAIIFRKQEIFKVNKTCEYDGYLIHRAAGFEVFFIIALVSLSLTSFISLYETILVGVLSGFRWYDALQIIPVGAFVAFIILYNRQVHKIFKGVPKEEVSENVALEEMEDIGSIELEELSKLDE